MHRIYMRCSGVRWATGNGGTLVSSDAPHLHAAFTIYMRCLGVGLAHEKPRRWSGFLAHLASEQLGRHWRRVATSLFSGS